MGTPLVSIGMPVYNGETFLEEALTSLLAQEYTNFELIILDNLSEDRTREICLKYAEKDARIRYVLDEKRRNGFDGVMRAVSLAKGKYYLPACDDDLWDKSYLSQLVRALEKDEGIGLAYSNGFFVNEGGVKSSRPLLSSESALYKTTNSKVYNFCSYLLLRHVVPLALGLFRMEVLRNTLPFVMFDATMADVDNLHVLKLLTTTKVQCLNETLLYYRVYPNKNRWEDPQYGKYPIGSGWLYLQFYFLKHKIKFGTEIFKIINESQFGFFKKLFLKTAAVSSLLLLPLIKKMHGVVVFFRRKKMFAGGQYAQS